MEHNHLITNYWKKYCENLPENERNRCKDSKVDAWAFGDSPKMADDLLQYVLIGEKTATAGLVVDYEIENEPIPEVGSRSIILNGKHEPACIIETTNVRIIKFDEVDEKFALAEGEGFQSLEDWRVAHLAFFNRLCQKLGLTFSTDMEVVCVEFKVVFK